MAGTRSITIYGTVMGTRPEDGTVVHRVEGTDPGGGRIELDVVARKHHRGSVKVTWDPSGQAEPRFPSEMSWTTLILPVVIITVIVLGGWLLFG